MHTAQAIETVYFMYDIANLYHIIFNRLNKPLMAPILYQAILQCKLPCGRIPKSNFPDKKFEFIILHFILCSHCSRRSHCLMEKVFTPCDANLKIDLML